MSQHTSMGVDSPLATTQSTLSSWSGREVADAPGSPARTVQAADIEATVVRVRDASGVAHAARQAAQARHVGLVLTTTGPDPFLDRIRFVQVAAGGSVYQMDLADVPQALESDALRAVLEGGVVKTCHDAKRSLRFLEELGIRGRRFFDPALAASLLSGGRLRGDAKELSLAALATAHAGVELEPVAPPAQWALMASPPHAAAAREAAVLPLLRRQLVERLTTAGMQRVARIEFECLGVLARMEHAGLPVDVERWTALIRRMDDGVERAGQRLREALVARGASPDGSPRHGAALTNMLRSAGVAVASSRREDLERAGLDPLVALALEFKMYTEYSESFGRSILDRVHPVTGRLHADFQQIGSVTGRIQSRRPALNIPGAPDFRQCIHSRPGYALVVADCSQMELRILASLSGDRVLREAFASGRDLHRRMAARMYGVEEGNVTPRQRKHAKEVNFLVSYGGGAAGLATKLQIGADEAERLIGQYFEAVPDVRRFLDACGREVSHTGRYVNTSGRLMVYADAPPATREERARAGRQGKNAPMQSTNADALKASLALVDERLQGTGARIVNSLHDEIVVEGPAGGIEATREIVVRAMTEAVQEFVPSTPVVVEAHTAEWWLKPDVARLFPAAEPARNI